MKIKDFWGFFSKPKPEECDQSNLSVYDKSGTFTFSSGHVFYRSQCTSADLSLKIATKVSFKSKSLWKFNMFKGILQKLKQRSGTKNNLSVSKRFCLKVSALVPPIVLLEWKKREFWTFELYFESKKRGMWPKKFKCFWQI